MAIVTSAGGAAGPVTVTPGLWWLKDPLNPALNCVVRAELDQPKVKTPESQTAFHLLGRSHAVVVSDNVVEGQELDLAFICTSDADWNALNAIRSTGHVLLLQSDAAEQWYVRLGPDLSRNTIRTVGGTVDQVRHVHITAVEVDAP